MNKIKRTAMRLAKRIEKAQLKLDKLNKLNERNMERCKHKSVTHHEMFNWCDDCGRCL